MRTFRLLAAGALSILPLTGFAEGAANGYFWKGGEDTAGIGAKAWFGFGGPVFFTARAQAGDVSDLDYTEARAGAGIGANVGTGKTAAVWADAQVIRLDVEGLEDDLGLGLFAGTSFSPVDRVWLDFEFGIVDGGDYGEASEFSVVAGYAIGPSLSVTVERSEEIVRGPVTQAGLRLTF